MPVIPVKSTGGYQLIDMKGMVISGSTTTTDKDIADAFEFAFKGKKPVYIHNYANDFFKGPQLLSYNNDDTALSVSLFSEGSVRCELSFTYNNMTRTLYINEYIPA